MIRPADLFILLLFLAGMAAMGVFFSKRNNSTEEYFLGNRAFPGWAVGLSMLGTSISSVTFLALPAAAFVLDYRQLVPNLTLPAVALLAAWIIIPFFRQGAAVSAFEYLEKRYGGAIRFYAAFSFVLQQQFRLSTVLYLVSIPLAEMLGVGIGWIILAGGIVVVFYTALGGIEAVIWTDVAQTIVLLLGGLLCVALVVLRLPEGFADVFRIGAEFDKFSLGPLETGFGERTLTVMIILGFINFGTEYTSNQNVVQRYLAARSTREARKATLLCAVMSVPTWLSFFFVGSCLFAFYHVYPKLLPEGIPADAVLPHFILHETPPGVAGIIIAACLAAAMSTLSSSVNAVSTVSTVDFVKRFRRDCSDAESLGAAKFFSWLSGALMIAGALVIDFIPRESMTDFTLILGSIFGGGMLAIYLLGFFTRRVGNAALLTGVGFGLVLNGWLLLNTFELLPETWRLTVHPYWTTILVNALVLAAALLASLLFPNRKNLTRLTVWTREPEENRQEKTS